MPNTLDVIGAAFDISSLVDDTFEAVSKGTNKIADLLSRALAGFGKLIIVGVYNPDEGKRKAVSGVKGTNLVFVHGISEPIGMPMLCHFVLKGGLMPSFSSIKVRDDWKDSKARAEFLRLLPVYADKLKLAVPVPVPAVKDQIPNVPSKQTGKGK